MRTLILLIVSMYICTLNAMDGYELKCEVTNACILERPSKCKFDVNSSTSNLIWKYNLRLKRVEYCVEKKAGEIYEQSSANESKGWFVISKEITQTKHEGNISWVTFSRELHNKTPQKGSISMKYIYTSDAIFKANRECSDSIEDVLDKYDDCTNSVEDSSVGTSPF